MKELNDVFDCQLSSYISDKLFAYSRWQSEYVIEYTTQE